MSYNIKQSKHQGRHPDFKNVGVYRCTKTQAIFYKAYISIKGLKSEKFFDNPGEASKWVDLQCIKNNIKQKNNSYVRK